MALEIVWTARAEKGYAAIIDYLETHFSEKEVRRFIHQSHEFFQLLSEYPEILESSRKQRNIHRGPMNKYTIITYRIRPRKKRIELLSIRSSRQKP